MNAITSLSEYLSVTKEISAEWGFSAGGELWFRGQSDSSYNLVPGTFRFKKESSVKREQIAGHLTESLIKSDIRNLEQFVTKSQSYLGGKNPQSNIDYYLLGQHYGLETRLLDWSTSPLTGLFFALEKYFSKDDININAAVFVLDPVWLNFIFHFCDLVRQPYLIRRKEFQNMYNTVVDYVRRYELKGVKVQHFDLNEDYFKWNKLFGINSLPIAILPPHIDNRIINQKSRFTLHGENPFFFEELMEKETLVCEDVEDYLADNIFRNIYSYKSQELSKIILDKNKSQKLIDEMNNERKVPFKNFVEHLHTNFYKRLGNKNRIRKITILKKHIPKIVNELKQAGYNHSLIYPDIEGLVLEMNKRVEVRKNKIASNFGQKKSTK